MKSVLISIRPKWVEKILSGEKTVEVRKTAPNIPTPFKCYIYETQGKTETPWIDEDGHMIFRGRGMVIGEFVCDRIYQYASDLFRSTPVEGVDISTGEMVKLSCLTAKELYEYEYSAEHRENCIYLVGVYGWHISNLVIYEKPKVLSSFNKPCPYKLPDGSRMSVPCPCDKYTWGFDEKTGLSYCMRRMARPPQSWCYVEEDREC